MSQDTSKIDLDYVAHLARLKLGDAERDLFAAQLQDILAYVAKLEEVDVTDVEPTAHAIPLVNTWRDDESRPSIDTAPVMANAPAARRDLFIVPKIVE